MGIRYINYQDRLENAYCGGYALAAMINLFDSSLTPDKPYGKSIYDQIQAIQRATLDKNRKCFIDRITRYLHDRNIEGTYSLPSSVSMYAKNMGLNPRVCYNESKLKENLVSVINNIGLEQFNVDDLIGEEISLIVSSGIPVVENVTNFSIMNSQALVEGGMHWIAIGDIKVASGENMYYDPESVGKPPYEYSGLNIVLNPFQ